MGFLPWVSNYNISLIHMFFSICCASFAISPLDYGSSLLNLSCIMPPIMSLLSILHMAAQIIFLKYVIPLLKIFKAKFFTLAYKYPPLSWFISLTSILYLTYIAKSLHFAKCKMLFLHSITLNTLFLLEYYSHFFLPEIFLFTFKDPMYLIPFQWNSSVQWPFSPIILLGLCSFSVLLFHSITSL